MSAAREFRLPDLGEGLTGAEIVRWLVSVGDVVTVDQPVVEVETAKAQVEVPCPFGGTVTARHGEPGEELPVGAPLIAVTAGQPLDTAPGGQRDEGSGQVLVGYGTGSGAGAGRRRRRATVTPPPSRAAEHASTTAPRWAAPDQETNSQPVTVISPLVRRLAREHGLDLRAVPGSGPDGLILRADVERAARPAAADTGSPVGPTRAPVPGEVRVPLKGIAGAMATAVTRSRAEIPDATCWVDADATELLAARRALEVPLLVLLARICTAALARHPALNATVDAGAREIVRLPAVHLGYAVQTERGLLVPVIRNAHTASTRRLGEEMPQLTSAARAGTLSPADLTGGTFTLNNYGVFGVDGSTPILTYPQAAMLGVGRITEKPWSHQRQLALRQVVQLSLTFDHRVCDGGTAGGFLRFVADRVEQPALLLHDL